MNKKRIRDLLLQPVDVQSDTFVAFTQLLDDQKTCIQKMI